MALLALIAVPTYGKVSIQWHMGRQQLSTPLGAAVYDSYATDNSMSIAEKRNYLVEQALQNGAKYIFFMGDDTIPPPDGFMRLYQRMEQNPDISIVTGVYFSRSYPPQPMLWRGWMQGSYYNWHVGEFFETDWAGCDCLMIRTDVFRSMPRPWFSQDYVFSAEQKKPIALATEDVYFYEKARKFGFSAWVDASVQCVHQDRESGQSFYLPNDWPQRIPGSIIGEPRPEHLIADLGCGNESPYTNATLVRIDLDESVNPDIRCDLHSIPQPDQHFDEVWSRHTLEHFGRDEAPALIQEWSRILKIGGTLKINVPNLEAAARTVLEYLERAGDDRFEYANWQIYGQQTAPLDFHKNGFTKRLLGKLVQYAWGDVPVHMVDAEGRILDAIGCFDEADITVEALNVDSGRSSLQLTAVKRRHPMPAVLGPEGRFSLLSTVSLTPDAPLPVGGTNDIADVQSVSIVEPGSIVRGTIEESAALIPASSAPVVAEPPATV